MHPVLSLVAGVPMLIAGIGDQSVSDIINTILAVLIAIDVHELGHALVADRSWVMIRRAAPGIFP